VKNGEIEVKKVKQLDNTGTPVWPIAQHILLHRVNYGIERYGEPLVVDNGLDMGECAIEEAIDGFFYIVAAVETWKKQEAEYQEYIAILEAKLSEHGIAIG
jgi:hypothetical protein